MVGRGKTKCRCTHLGENIFNYKIISIVLLAEFSNRCSSCCIAVRRIDNIHEIGTHSLPQIICRKEQMF